VDDFASVTESMTVYGVGNGSTTVTTTMNLDLANWLVKRPKKVVTEDRSYDATGLLTGKRTVEYIYFNNTLDRHLVKQEKTYGVSESAGNVLTVDYEYYADGQVKRRTATDVNTGRTRETTFAYDPFGRPHSVTSPLGTSYSGHDAVLGKPKVVVDINGLRTDYTYDGLGRLVKTRRPDGAENTVTYSLEPRRSEYLLRVEASDPTGTKSQTIVDRAGRTLVERFKGFDGQMRERTNEYDVRGQLIATSTFKRQGSTESVDVVTREYDNLGRLVRQIEPGNAVRRWDYDRLVATHTDTGGKKKSTTLDQRGRIIATTDGLGSADAATRSYGYAPFGKLSRTKIEGIAASESTYVYADGELVSTNDEGDGESFDRTTDWIVDDMGRVTSKTVKEGGATRSITTNTYDAITGAGARSRAGALLRSELMDFVGGGKHSTDFWFDALGRPLYTDVAADDPDGGEREALESIARWSHKGFHRQHYSARLARVQTALYRGDAEGAWRRHAEDEGVLRRSLLTRVQVIRVEARYLRARVALAMAARPGASPRFLAIARDEARRIARERMPWSDPIALLLSAATAYREGHAPRALERLHDAAGRFERADMNLYAAVTRRRIGALQHDARGCELLRQAEEWMAAQQIKNPMAMTRMLAPGFPDA
jgi:YD repeat-containing protein